MSAAPRPAPVDTRRSLAIAGAGVAIALLLELALDASGDPARAITFLGRFHPLAVHLPIGVILLVGALEVLALSPRLRVRIDPALPTVLLLAFGSALAAFALGLMLAQSGEHPASVLRAHQRFALATVVASAGALVAWSRYRALRGSRQPYRCAVLATVALLSVGAHFGGSMTHGENYLVEYAPWSGRPKAGASQETSSVEQARAPRVFDDVVLPVLKQKCAGCHGPDKAKGGLRADSFEALVKGGKEGPAIDVGRPERSRLVQRVRSPVSADGHMPPEGKPQLTPAELELIEFWIGTGARTDLEVRALIVPDGARSLLSGAATNAPGATQVEAARASGEPATPPVESAREAAKSSATSAPAIATATAGPSPMPGAALTFRDVAPILASKCGRCHGAKRHAGGLRTDSIGALVRGGHSGAAIVAGEPGRGTLLARVRRPVEDDDHMPPSDEPQLDPRELRALLAWVTRAGAEIDRGAAQSTKGRAEPPGVALAAPSTVSPQPSLAPAGQVPEEASGSTPRASPTATGVTLRPSDAASADMTAPAPRGGCAGCAIAPEDVARGPAAVAVIALVALALGRRRAQRRAPRARLPPVT